MDALRDELFRVGLVGTQAQNRLHLTHAFIITSEKGRRTSTGAVVRKRSRNLFSFAFFRNQWENHAFCSPYGAIFVGLNRGSPLSVTSSRFLTLCRMALRALEQHPTIYERGQRSRIPDIVLEHVSRAELFNSPASHQVIHPASNIA